MAEITTDITGDDTVSLVAITADGYGHITGTNIAAVLGIDQGQSVDPAKGRPAVKVAATVNVTLSGEQTIAGAACVAGDRVLLTAQTAAEENRPYVVAAGAWSAAGDSLVSGAWWYATDGDNPGLWQLTTADPITPGTTELAIVLLATGDTAAHASSHASGGSDALTLAESQVTGLTAALAGKSATTHNHDTTYAPLYPEYGVYASGNTGSIAAAASGVIALDTAFAAVSGFAVSAGEVTLPAAGRYRVEYDVGAEFTTASTKGRVTVNLQTDNSGDWATVTGAATDVANPGGSSTTLYQRDAATGRGYVTTTGTNKKLRLYAGPVQTAGSAVVFLANTCRLTVTQVPA